MGRSPKQRYSSSLQYQREGHVGAHQGVDEVLDALQSPATEAAGLQNIEKGPRAQGWLPVFQFGEEVPQPVEFRPPEW
ncbi:MAG: hypothetical protein AB1543_05820 [Candidatus Bipolaricaulota bacterium]